MQHESVTPTKQVLDNEASAAYKEAIQESGMTYKLVPPDDHRRNAAEKAMQTWKDHFVAVLSSTADDFPLHFVVPTTTTNGTTAIPPATN